MFRKKTPEELAAIERERLLAEQRKREEGFAKTPAGQARLARSQGANTLQISLPLSESKGQVVELFGPIRTFRMRTGTHGSVFDSIEAEGCRLERPGYTFVMTGTESRTMTLANGQSEAVSGMVMGIYIFRRIEAELEKATDQYRRFP